MNSQALGSSTQPSFDAQSTASAIAPASSNEMEREGFMDLLLLQMRSQDPMSPMDTTAMFNQMAQLSMLEQLWDIRDALTTTSGNEQLTQGAMMLGRHVEAHTVEFGAISGLVEQVRMVSGQVLLQVGEQEIPMSLVVSVE